MTMKVESDIKRALVIPDMHVKAKGAGVDHRALAAVEKYMASHRWSHVIQLGDFMDHDSISHHNRDNMRAIENQTLEKDYQLGGQILDRWRGIVGEKCEIVILEGNHDNRPERLIDKQPQLKGRIETEVGLELKRRGIRYVKFWSKDELYRLGNVYFAHGRYVCDHHAKKHVQAYGINIVYGHEHDVQSYSLTQKGKNRALVGQSLGCLCLPQDWMKGAPTRWQQAIGTFFIQPNGNFNYYVSRIFDAKFAGPDGVMYSG